MEQMQDKAKRLVKEMIEENLEKTDSYPEFEIYVVWFSKTLQNWKALVSTTLPDQMYYEVTYNGNTKETYIDAYKKWRNKVVRDDIPSYSVTGTNEGGFSTLAEHVRS